MIQPIYDGGRPALETPVPEGWSKPIRGPIKNPKTYGSPNIMMLFNDQSWQGYAVGNNKFIYTVRLGTKVARLNGITE